MLSITKSLIFAQSNDYVWHEVVLAETHAEKERLLRDPDASIRVEAARVRLEQALDAAHAYISTHHATIQEISHESATA